VRRLGGITGEDTPAEEKPQLSLGEIYGLFGHARSFYCPKLFIKSSCLLI